MKRQTTCSLDFCTQLEPIFDLPPVGLNMLLRGSTKEVTTTFFTKKQNHIPSKLLVQASKAIIAMKVKRPQSTIFEYHYTTIRCKKLFVRLEEELKYWWKLEMCLETHCKMVFFSSFKQGIEELLQLLAKVHHDGISFPSIILYLNPFGSILYFKTLYGV